MTKYESRGILSVEFLLRAMGKADCLSPRFFKSVAPDKSHGSVQITLANKTPLRLNTFQLDMNGVEGSMLDKSGLIEPHGSVTITTAINTVFRVRTAGPRGRLLTEVLVDRTREGGGQRHFDIVDCPTLDTDPTRRQPPPPTKSPSVSSPPPPTLSTFRGAILFEDDVTFDPDFVGRVLHASESLPADWDVFL